MVWTEGDYDSAILSGVVSPRRRGRSWTGSSRSPALSGEVEADGSWLPSVLDQEAQPLQDTLIQPH